MPSANKAGLWPMMPIVVFSAARMILLPNPILIAKMLRCSRSVFSMNKYYPNVDAILSRTFGGRKPILFLTPRLVWHNVNDNSSTNCGENDALHLSQEWGEVAAMRRRQRTPLKEASCSFLRQLA